MSKQKFIDKCILTDAISILKPDGQLFEVRLIGKQRGYKVTWSGYFRDTETLLGSFANDIHDYSHLNGYITLNELNPVCYNRDQRDRFIRADNTTGDTDVTRYQWFFVDLDPIRPSGTSSANEQLQAAKEKAESVKNYLRERGFSKPLYACSGNGYHLLYRVNFERSAKNVKLMERALKALSMLFTDDKTKVDATNFNPSRICKLYGTRAQKGADTPEAPHRMSKIIDLDVGEVNDRKLLERLAAAIPEPEPRQSNYSGAEFDLNEWMNQYCTIPFKVVWTDDGTRYELDHCPFDSNHTGRDACVFQYKNGGIGFKCFHDSCSDKTWRDFRLCFEPDA